MLVENHVEVSDKEIVRQILEREVLNIYQNIVPQLGNNLGLNINGFLMMPQIQEKVFNYADLGIEYMLSNLFGTPPCDADEALDVANLMVNEKIEEMRKKVRESKKVNND